MSSSSLSQHQYWPDQTANILSCTLDTVLCALELEEQWDAASAVINYEAAASQLTDLIEKGLLAEEPLILETCKGFIQTYNDRIQVKEATFRDACGRGCCLCSLVFVSYSFVHTQYISRNVWVNVHEWMHGLSYGHCVSDEICPVLLH